MKCRECSDCTKIIKGGKEVFICFKGWIEKEVNPSDECKEIGNILDNWCKGDDPCSQLKKRDKQLTRAKGIIKDLLKCLPKENIEGIYEVTEEAEQFINEVEL